MPLARMLRIYFLQHWFNLSDPAMEDALYDSEAMRRFAGIALGDDAVPDESTILRFRHLLERHQLTEAIFAAVRTLLEERQLLLKAGTIVDATIIEAPPSTKNAEKARDPEMHQTRKGSTWHFGMKAHIGTDLRGIVHSLTTTAAHVADITQLPDLLHGEERVLHGDQAYWWACSVSVDGWTTRLSEDRSHSAARSSSARFGSCIAHLLQPLTQGLLGETALSGAPRPDGVHQRQQRVQRGVAHGGARHGTIQRYQAEAARAPLGMRPDRGRVRAGGDEGRSRAARRTR
jgi:IS5 family transposase